MEFGSVTDRINGRASRKRQHLRSGTVETHPNHHFSSIPEVQMCLSCHNTIHEISLVMRVLHPTRNALGLTKTGWRALCRSVATALSDMREPVRTAQQILGHASAQTTLAYYAQSVEESQRSAILRLEKIMFPSCGQAPS